MKFEKSKLKRAKSPKKFSPNTPIAFIVQRILCQLDRFKKIN